MNHSPMLSYPYAQSLIAMAFSKDLENQSIEVVQPLFVRLRDAERKALKEGVNCKSGRNAGYIIKNLSGAITHVAQIREKLKTI